MQIPFWFEYFLVLGIPVVIYLALNLLLVVWLAGEFRKGGRRSIHNALLGLFIAGNLFAFALVDGFIGTIGIPAAVFLAFTCPILYWTVREAPRRLRNTAWTALVLGTLLISFVPWHTGKVLHYDMNKIKPGMTQAQVREMLKARTITMSEGKLLIRHPKQAPSNCEAIVIRLDEQDIVSTVEFIGD